jgi:GNAT superfamily N-acetyltransferase
MIANLNFREALASDAASLTALYRLLKADSKIEVDPQRLDELRDNPQSILLVCEVDNKIMGTAHVSFCPDAMYGRQPFAIVENVVVAEGFRSRGIGAALMSCVDELCFSRDCSKIMLLSNAHRADAHRFFARSGYSSSKKVGFVKYRSEYSASQSPRRMPGD